MPKVISKGDEVTISLSTVEKVWSLHGDFHFDKHEIVSLSTTVPKTTFRELRLPGTYLPWVIKAGTYFTPRGKEFWYTTRGKDKPLAIKLKNNTYKQLIIGFETLSDRDMAKSYLTK